MPFAGLSALNTLESVEVNYGTETASSFEVHQEMSKKHTATTMHNSPFPRKWRHCQYSSFPRHKHTDSGQPRCAAITIFAAEYLTPDCPESREIKLVNTVIEAETAARYFCPAPNRSGITGTKGMHHVVVYEVLDPHVRKLL
ncbi:hypothetical protein F5Y16DRAFT_44005 [Xylariaceae sp. FL0255]|nr:hypothetical protein F5Y16DRAFT_44005 [Xylariaceae sp. FL0255]